MKSKQRGETILVILLLLAALGMGAQSVHEQREARSSYQVQFERFCDKNPEDRVCE